MADKKLTVYFTSDLHGYIYPTDYRSRDERDIGLFKCASRFEKDGNTLVIDGGDLLQGSPLGAFCHDTIGDGRAFAGIMNRCGYDYVTLGNHDFNFGYDALHAYLLRLDAEKPVVYCGDLNVAHEEIDIKNPKANRQNAGFSDEERAKMTRLLSSGFADTFRRLHPDLAGVYSWWSYRFHARENNAGWRIDYFIVSERLLPRVVSSEIRTDVLGSDHCPVVLEIS